VQRVKTIKDLRIEQGWSQQDLAVKLGVTVGTVSNWERGKFEPTASKFKAIALVFGVPMESIALVDESLGMGKAAA